MSTVRAYIHEQPAALRRALAPLEPEVLDSLLALAPERVLLVGSGTSSFAARVIRGRAARLLGVPVEVALPTDVLHYLPDAIDERTLVVAVSQSGRSTATLRSLAVARDRGARTVLVTGEPVRPGLADVVVDLRCGPEEVGAKTKGFTATIATLAAVLGGAEDLAGIPERVAAALDTEPLVSAWARSLAPSVSVSITGSGPNLATAQEAALKILETARIPVEAVETEEFLHGPHRRLGPGLALVVLALDGPLLPRALALIDYAAPLVAGLLVVTDTDTPLPDRVTAVRLAPGLPEELTPLPAIVPLQLLAVALTEHLGLSPEDAVLPDFHTRLASKETP